MFAEQTTVNLSRLYLQILDNFEIDFNDLKTILLISVSNTEASATKKSSENAQHSCEVALYCSAEKRKLRLHRAAFENNSATTAIAITSNYD
jgi:hypothetical protein